MRTLLLPVIAAILAAAGCASAPNTTTTVTGRPAPIPVHFVGCSSTPLLPPILAGSNPDAALLLFGFAVTFDVATLSTCAVERLAHAGAAGTVSDGVYHSWQKTFSVALPLPPAGAVSPSINVIQPSMTPVEAVLLQPMTGDATVKAGAASFGAGSFVETAQQRSETLEQAALSEIDASTVNMGASAVLLRHSPTTLDGRPALFAVFHSAATPARSDVDPGYLLVYLTRDQGSSAMVTIHWRGACAVCDTGSEADIRKLDPNISLVVDSFHLDEAALRGREAASPVEMAKAATTPAPVFTSVPLPAGKAMVYFYRVSRFAGGGLHFNIAENDTEINTLKNGTYMHLAADPGAHTYIMTTWGSDDDPCPVQLKSGEVRYFEIYVSQAAVWGKTMTLSCREVADLQAQPVIAALKEANDD